MQVLAPRAAVLVARDHEADRAVDALRFSGGVMLTGEAGVGKTALAAAVVQRLPTPPVGWVLATAAARTVPLGALAGLLPSDLASIHPALVAQHVDARLRELAQRRSAPVLVVDDAQLLDAQSAAVLLSLAAARSVRLLLTVRSGEPSPDAVTALWKDGLVERLDLSPLSLWNTRILLESLLDGPVASATVEMLWTSSHGNPFSLTEFTRYGAERGQLEQRAGVWWWLGDTGMPPRLGEVLRHRMTSVSSAGREAVDLLAMGEPLPYETLSALVGDEVILELDGREILRSDDQDGTLLLRFAHPLLQAVAESELSPARRRALAGRLRLAPAAQVDVIRRASWDEAAGGPPNVALLLAGADAVMMNDAETAVRWAARAHQAGGGVAAAVVLAAAHAECGRSDRARILLEAAEAEVTDLRERRRLLGEHVGLALWAERDPARATAAVERMRRELPNGSYRVAEALVRLFSGGCRDVLPLTATILNDDPSPEERIQALILRTGALAFADQGEAAIASGQLLLDTLDDTLVSATWVGLAYALIATTGLFYGAEYRLPSAVGPLGRWPGPPARLGPGANLDLDEGVGVGWPLLVGLRRHLAGDLAGAVGPLREAYVQQQAGEGLFRSEATAELVVVLAELGEGDEAASIMAQHSPDAVAIIPGLTDWAAAAVAAAQGRPAVAGPLAVAAARTAAATGCAAMAMNFLCDAARYGDPRAAAAVLPELGLPMDTDVQRIRALDITARADGSPGTLLDAAETALLAGFARHAAEMAEQARAADSSGAAERRAAAVLRECRRLLGDQVEVAPSSGGGSLTQRELEIARLAGRGRSDRDIADELVLSIRTVQSHLASAYRKLGISSRSALVGLV